MAKERLSMRKIKEVLRLHFEHQQSTRQIAKSWDIARSTVKEYLERAEKAGLSWPLPAELSVSARNTAPEKSSSSIMPAKPFPSRTP